MKGVRARLDTTSYFQIPFSSLVLRALLAHGLAQMPLYVHYAQQGLHSQAQLQHSAFNVTLVFTPLLGQGRVWTALGGATLEQGLEIVLTAA
jgi:hypothetical protein